MKQSLFVYYNDRRVGTLRQDEHGAMSFEYDSNWLQDPLAIPLSQSLPLRDGIFKKNECLGFFGGILPEELNREVIAKNLGVSSRNDFVLLQHIGGECAGAVSFQLESELPEVREECYKPLDDDALADLLKRLPNKPLLAGEKGVRISLAGAQDKLVLRYQNGQFFIPCGSAPSTHILKPKISRFSGTVPNEAYCMQLADLMGLRVSKVETCTVNQIDFLNVERYDRLTDGQGKIIRLHQEDFCQALGIVSERKYQKEGGPGLVDCFNLLRAASTVPAADLGRLLDAVIFNVLIGNNDAHGKNFSILYTGGDIQLAPLYDLLCTAFYPEVSTAMAMKIGKARTFDELFPFHFQDLAKQSGLAPKPVIRRVINLAEIARDSVDKLPVPEGIRGIDDLIRTRIDTLLKRFK